VRPLPAGSAGEHEAEAGLNAKPGFQFRVTANDDAGGGEAQRAVPGDSATHDEFEGIERSTAGPGRAAPPLPMPPPRDVAGLRPTPSNACSSTRGVGGADGELATERRGREPREPEEELGGEAPAAETTGSALQAAEEPKVHEPAPLLPAHPLPGAGDARPRMGCGV